MFLLDTASDGIWGEGGGIGIESIGSGGIGELVVEEEGVFEEAWVMVGRPEMEA